MEYCTAGWADSDKRDPFERATALIQELKDHCSHPQVNFRPNVVTYNALLRWHANTRDSKQAGY